MFEYFRKQLYVIGGIAKTKPLSCSCINSRRVTYIRNRAPGGLKCRNSHADEVYEHWTSQRTISLVKTYRVALGVAYESLIAWFVRCYLKTGTCRNSPGILSVVLLPSPCSKCSQLFDKLFSRTVNLSRNLLRHWFSRDLIVLLPVYWDF